MRIILLLSLSLLVAKSASCQRRNLDSLYTTLYSPSNRSVLVSPFTQVAFASTFGNQSASAQVGFRTGNSAFSVFINQPFDERPKKVTPLTLNGLANGASAEIGYQFVSWNPSADTDAFDDIRNTYARRKGIKDIARIRAITYQDLIQDPWSRKQLKGVIDFGTPVFLGINFAVGKSAIDYITDSTAIKPFSTTKISHNVRLSAGIMDRNSGIFALSITFLNVYDPPGDPITYSFPAGNSGARYTKDVVVGEPVINTRQLFKLEYRRNFVNRFSLPSLAINPSISYLTALKKLNIEIPIYFLRISNDKQPQVSGLQGGVTLAYATPVSEFVPFVDNTAISLFIAAPFSLLNLFRTR